MKKTELVDGTELLATFHHDTENVKGELQRHRFCYLASIDLDEFKQLLLNSSPENPQPASWADLPTLEEVVMLFQDDPTYFNAEHPNRGISGKQVKHYVDLFADGLELKHCVVRD